MHKPSSAMLIQCEKLPLNKTTIPAALGIQRDASEIIFLLSRLARENHLHSREKALLHDIIANSLKEGNDKKNVHYNKAILSYFSYIEELISKPKLDVDEVYDIHYALLRAYFLRELVQKIKRETDKKWAELVSKLKILLPTCSVDEGQLLTVLLLCTFANDLEIIKAYFDWFMRRNCYSYSQWIFDEAYCYMSMYVEDLNLYALSPTNTNNKKSYGWLKGKVSACRSKFKNALGDEALKLLESKIVAATLETHREIFEYNQGFVSNIPKWKLKLLEQSDKKEDIGKLEKRFKDMPYNYHGITSESKLIFTENEHATIWFIKNESNNFKDKVQVVCSYFNEKINSNFFNANLSILDSFVGQIIVCPAKDSNGKVRFLDQNDVKMPFLERLFQKFFEEFQKLPSFLKKLEEFLGEFMDRLNFGKKYLAETRERLLVIFNPATLSISRKDSIKALIMSIEPYIKTTYSIDMKLEPDPINGGIQFSHEKFSKAIQNLSIDEDDKANEAKKKFLSEFTYIFRNIVAHAENTFFLHFLALFSCIEIFSWKVFDKPSVN